MGQGPHFGDGHRDERGKQRGEGSLEAEGKTKRGPEP